MNLKVGDKAPEFELYNQNAEKISLKNLISKNLVVLFYPFANSSLCTKEMCLVRDEFKSYQELKANIAAISVDSHYTLKMWAEKHNYNFNLLSDFNKKVSEKYGVLDEVFYPGKFAYQGVSKRAAFVIDKNGIVKYNEVIDDPDAEPDYNKIKQILKQI